MNLVSQELCLKNFQIVNENKKVFRQDSTTACCLLLVEITVGSSILSKLEGFLQLAHDSFRIDKPRSSHRQSSQESSPKFLDGKNFFNTFSAGELSSSNAFMSPQWGGIMIYNLPRTTSTNNTKPQQMIVEMKPVMNVFLSQLKLLLGMMPVVRSSRTFN